MEGLEVSIVALSALERTHRIDAEYFRHDFRTAELLVSSLASESIVSVAKVSDGNHFTISDAYTDVGIPYFRGQDVSGTFFADADKAIPITREAYDKPYMSRSHLQRGDVLLSIVGTIGSTALVDTDEPATCSCKLAILRPKSISSAYLATYLASSFGQRRIEQLTRGALQRGLLLEDADQILVPRVGDVEVVIDRLISQSRRARDDSRVALAEAETLLLNALGLRDWSPPEPLTYTRSAADVIEAGRLDSQYYMPAKQEMLEALGRLPGALLSDSFDSIREMIDPNKGSPATIVRNYDLTDALQPVLDATAEPTTFSEIDSQKKRLRDGDLAVARLRSYLKEIAVVRVTDNVPSIGSSEFFVLRRTAPDIALSAGALMVYLKSPPVQTILKWCQDGSQHPRFSERDLMAIPLPDAVTELNHHLTAMVDDALIQRARSLALLEVAKRAVEIAVEDSETAALAFVAEQEATHAPSI